MDARDKEDIHYVRDRLDRHESDTGKEFDDLKERVSENSFKIRVLWAGVTFTLATVIGWIVNSFRS